MAQSPSAIILVIGALLLFASSICADGESPFLVAHKKATLKRRGPDTERVSVSIDIYNRGSMSAYDVSLTDDSWDKDLFDFIHGNTSKSWKRLDANALVSHSFELETKVKGLFYGTPALITFKIPTKAAVQVAYSTPILPLDILADKTINGKFELAKRLLANYGSQVSVISLVIIFGYLIATSAKSSGKRS
ncbi:translocon-associated protein subunit beta-like [Carica papaya]|uniref:translocon-associated protein subunit beta-like n=1 Tax=Carica papaya TaxID=3649 RepID=UPI000B8D1783|nr:translocon-associated protein subunit beta-like [Carica papaya]